MNLGELSDLLERSTDVLRVETRGSYASDTDRDWLAAYLRGDPQPDVELKRAWLDRLAAAAERGHPWRRLRVIPNPITDYFRYQCEWSYLDNVAAGEQIQVISLPDWTDDHFLDDYYLADGRIVWMYYNSNGRFTKAEAEKDSLFEAAQRNRTEVVWQSRTSPFTEWWADSPELHRDVTV
jgi:hypothetical protein